MEEREDRDEQNPECQECECPGPGDFLRDQLSRRGFIRVGMGGLLSLVLANWLDKDVKAQRGPQTPKAKRCILLWMNGGPTHIDTWDPKPKHRNGGPVRAIRTSAPGVEISEYFEQTAEVCHHLAIIRSMTSREGDHARAQYLLHTGYVPNPTVEHPSLGAIVSHQIGDPEFDLPNFISIRGSSLGAGYLGMSHSPFIIQDPNRPPDNMEYAKGVDANRFARRLRFLNYFETQMAQLTQSEKVPDRHTVYDKAVKLMHSPLARAFDISEEPMAYRRAYGEQSSFGQGVLMARRLLEAGVKFVEVGLDGWDTHSNNFVQVENKVKNDLDPALASLIKDLEDRQMLQDTLIIWMGEFGRTPRINQNEGRDHYPAAFSVVLAGGPVKGGQVIGATDEGGETVIHRPVTAPDLFASICYALGIDYRKEIMTKIGRPMPLADRGSKVVQELFTA